LSGLLDDDILFTQLFGILPFLLCYGRKGKIDAHIFAVGRWGSNLFL
jgi:hypothetical protein